MFVQRVNEPCKERTRGKNARGPFWLDDIWYQNRVCLDLEANVFTVTQRYAAKSAVAKSSGSV